MNWRNVFHHFSLQIKVGTDYLHSWEQEEREEGWILSPFQVVAHPQYASGLPYFDTAVVHLEEHLDLGGNVQSIQMNLGAALDEEEDLQLTGGTSRRKHFPLPNVLI